MVAGDLKRRQALTQSWLERMNALVDDLHLGQVILNMPARGEVLLEKLDGPRLPARHNLGFKLVDGQEQRLSNHDVSQLRPNQAVILHLSRDADRPVVKRWYPMETDDLMMFQLKELIKKRRRQTRR